MRINQAANAPLWLLAAETRDADIEITEDGIVLWRAGNFLGGDFRAGGVAHDIAEPGRRGAA
ncbi:MAG: hypothetical protein ACYCOU_00020 [Sulfobacillus sp.]